MNCTRTGANCSELSCRVSGLPCVSARLARLNGRQARVDLPARLGRAFEIGPVALVVVGGHKPLEMCEGGLKAADAVEDGRAVRPRDVCPHARVGGRDAGRVAKSPACGGKRYKDSTLEVKIRLSDDRDYSIADVLDMTADEATRLFFEYPSITWGIQQLCKVGLGYLKLGQPLTTLSGGERRRVEIARALATDPAFILLDEPFAGIDPIAVADIQGMIAHLAQRGIGVLITDHNVRETLSIVDKAYILAEGHILLHGDSETIANDPVARKYYLGDNFSM